MVHRIWRVETGTDGGDDVVEHGVSKHLMKLNEGDFPKKLVALWVLRSKLLSLLSSPRFLLGHKSHAKGGYHFSFILAALGLPPLLLLLLDSRM